MLEYWNDVNYSEEDTLFFPLLVFSWELLLVFCFLFFFIIPLFHHSDIPVFHCLMRLSNFRHIKHFLKETD